MSLSLSRQNYEDCYEVLDKALEAEDGVRVGFEDQDQATYYRMRMNQARQLDRKFNGERYAPTDPRRLRSDYDVLSIRIKRSGGEYWVYVEKQHKPKVIEEIKAETEAKPKREFITHRRF